jgi:hypothetical protein
MAKTWNHEGLTPRPFMTITVLEAVFVQFFQFVKQEIPVPVKKEGAEEYLL